MLGRSPFSKSIEIDEDLAQVASIGYLDIQNVLDERQMVFNAFRQILANQNRLSQYGMRPTGIYINKGVNGAATATIRGILQDDRDSNVQNWTLNVRQEYNLAFRRIYNNGTTGVGIKLMGA